MLYAIKKSLKMFLIMFNWVSEFGSCQQQTLWKGGKKYNKGHVENTHGHFRTVFLNNRNFKMGGFQFPELPQPIMGVEVHPS